MSRVFRTFGSGSAAPFTGSSGDGCFQALIPQAKGRVLEIGGGTGANLPFYEGIETLTLTEPDKPMIHRLERRRHVHGCPGRAV